MKIILFTFLTFIFSFGTPGPDCKKLKNGQFYTQDPDGTKTFIERKGKKQVESNHDGSLQRELSVIWISDCTYYLIHKKLVKGEEYIPESFLQDTMSVTITEITDSSYFTSTTMLNHPMELRQEVMISEK